ncbi:hypothetical protein BFW38_12290 [Terasakiispira papahanaumokuakeensis]|uniref:HDOD domain-containing protein n=2 Tax=Terasakiispira papahanaumokuakeensis TaxID=197479 RepID=A0A1E2VBF4_9GAMM|nr:hypothetical protein BFW38_12290 [Terasakiispira papahanaumokuakeensis]
MSHPESMSEIGQFPAPSPQAETWGKRLAELEAPILSQRQQLQRMLSPSISLLDLEHALAADPMLAWPVLLKAAQLPRIGGQVQGLQHALNLLGLDKTQACIRAHSKPAYDRNQPGHTHYLQALSVGEFAAQLLRLWESPQYPGGTEHMAWSTMLLSLGRYLMPLLEPKLMAQLERRVALGERRSRVEHSLLGCNLAEITIAMLRLKGLPESQWPPMIDSRTPRHIAAAGHFAWTDIMAPELPRHIALWLRRPNTGMLLAHLLAWRAYDGWYDRATWRLLHTVSAYLNQPLSQVVASVHHCAARTSRLQRHTEIVTVGELLLHPPRAPRTLNTDPTESRSHTESQRAATAAPALQTTSHDDALNVTTPAPDIHHLKQWLKAVQQGQYTDLRALMHSAAITMTKGLGIERCLLLMRPPKSEALRCYYAHGFVEPDHLRQLTLTEHSDGVLARMMNDGGALKVNADRVNAIKRQLPPPLNTLCLQSGLLLASIHLNHHVVGLLWADTGHAEIQLHDQHYLGFKKVAQAISHGFALQAKGRQAIRTSQPPGS